MKKVIFDVDGVLLSEKRYFDVSALVVWEWYYSPRYMHLKPERITADLDDDTIAALRARFWRNDDILLWLKKHGVNSNWDMVHAHIVVTLWLMLEKYVADHGGLEGSLKKIDDIQYLGSLLRGLSRTDGRRRLSPPEQCHPRTSRQGRSLYLSDQCRPVVPGTGLQAVDAPRFALVAAGIRGLPGLVFRRRAL